MAEERKGTGRAHIGRSSLMSLHLCTLALSSTTNVFLWMRSESWSIKSAILSAVIFSVVENPSYLLLRSIMPKMLSLNPLSEGM